MVYYLGITQQQVVADNGSQLQLAYVRSLLL